VFIVTLDYGAQTMEKALGPQPFMVEIGCNEVPWGNDLFAKAYAAG
jgi:hypothetical protein